MTGTKADDFSRLEAKLAKLRQRERGPGEPRYIRGSADRLLAAFVSEVDETILPREIGFSLEGGTSFHVAVANRRLQALVSVVPATLAKGNDLLNTPITDAEDATLNILGDLLIEVFAKGDAWTISSRRQSGGGFPSDIGVPSGPLARAWKVSATSRSLDPAGRLADFLSTHAKTATAWLLIEGEEVKGQGGDSEVVAVLSESAALFLDGYFSRKDALFQGEAGPNGLVFTTATTDQAVVFIDFAGSMAFVSAERKDAMTLARAWQASVAI